MNSSIAFAGVGGFAINILQLMEYAKRPKIERPDFRDFLFYAPYLGWPVLASIVSYAYVASGVQLSPILALNVGLSCPLIYRAMAEVSPIKPAVIDPGPGA